MQRILTPLATHLTIFVFLTLATLSMFAAAAPTQPHKVIDRSWTTEFNLEPNELATTGRNSYFILEPGYELVLQDGAEQLIITVLNETKKVANVETRIVEERETKGGQMVEVSRNYFAISKRTNSVFYFGEDVDMYKAGQVVSHEGSWQAGTNGARFGLMMPGIQLLGAKYYQEIYPGVAMDRATVVSVSEMLRTPAGQFRNVLKVAETTPLEPRTTEYKYYAGGVGLLQDGSLKLVRFGKVD